MRHLPFLNTTQWLSIFALKHASLQETFATTKKREREDAFKCSFIAPNTRGENEQKEEEEKKKKLTSLPVMFLHAHQKRRSFTVRQTPKDIRKREKNNLKHS